MASTSAHAAELVAAPTDEVRVTQGQLSTVNVAVRADGIIGCGVTRSSPARATYDSVVSLVGGETATATPAAPLPFYANGGLVLLPPLGCGTTWDGAPEPYSLELTVAAAPDTPPGLHTVVLNPAISNPGGALFAPLENDVPDVVPVTVEAPEEPSAELPPPVENRSVNLLPVRGDVFFRYPGSERARRLLEPVQVPPRTGVNATGGFMTLLSDRLGSGEPQSLTLWQGSFRVNYTRVADPLRPGRRARHPITELTLRGAGSPCSSSRASAGPGVRASKRRRRGLWGRGNGRFRTKGRYGAGTVRGTFWHTQETCEGTLFRVRRGRVSVADLPLGESFLIGPRQSYLARPAGRGGARG